MQKPAPGAMPFQQPPTPPVPAQPQQQQSPLFMQALQALEQALQHHQHVTHVRRALHPHHQKGVRTGPMAETKPGAMGIRNALIGTAPPPVNPTATFDARNMPSKNALARDGAGNPPTSTNSRGR